MATNELISELVRDLRPVSPLPMPRVRVARWAVATGVSTLIAIAVVGLRADLGAVALSPTFQVHALLLVIAAFGSAAVALASAVPGDPTAGWRRAAPLLAVVGWWLWLAAEVRWLAVGSELWPVTEGWGCVAKAMFVGFVPAAVLTAMIARAAPQDLRRTCLFAGLAAAAVGALGVEVTCPMNSPTHLLVWHGGPVMMTVVLVTLIAALATRGFGALRIR